MDARSLSTTSAVTWKVVASTTIASPDGASRPLTTLTAVTMPSIGAVRVAEPDLGLHVVAGLGRVGELRRRVVDADLRLADLCGDRGVIRRRSGWPSARRSWILAVSTAVFAAASWRLRSAVSAVARTAPFLTASPTATFRSLTVHVVEPAAAGELARWAGVPKASPYEELVATVPVAATSSATSPVVAAPVRYWVFDAALAGSPPTATNAAPTPTAANATMARIFSFMDVSRGRRSDRAPLGGAPIRHSAPRV
jgi:hypothetical protein